MATFYLTKLYRVLYMILHRIAYFYNVIFEMVDNNLARVEAFLKNWHFSFIGQYRLTSIQQGKVFMHTFILTLKNCIKCMRPWEGMRNLFYF